MADRFTADVMSARMVPDGTRIVDRGLLTFLLEARHGRWHVCEVIRARTPEHHATINTWARSA